MTDFSYQLYSSRNFPPMSDTLKMVAATGYTQVEGYGAMFSDDADLGALKAELDALGLSMPTAHIAVTLIQSRPERVIEIAKTLGLDTVFAPHIAEPERPVTASGWSEFGRELEAAGKPLTDAGLTFGWHNHAFEFVAVEGALPMDLMLAEAPSLKMELDVAWCVKGGEDPIAWMEKNADRIAGIHVKDIAPEGEAQDEDGWADVGHGTMDWQAIMDAARKTPCRYFVAEHDNPNDHKRFAARSLASMQSY